MKRYDGEGWWSADENNRFCTSSERRRRRRRLFQISKVHLPSASRVGWFGIEQRNGDEIGNQKPSAAVVSININLLSFPVPRACFLTFGCKRVAALGVDASSSCDGVLPSTAKSDHVVQTILFFNIIRRYRKLYFDIKKIT